MIQLGILLILFVGLGGVMLIVQKYRKAAAEQLLYTVGLGAVGLTWLLIALNFNNFVEGWRQYQSHSIVTQAPSSNITLRYLAPFFNTVFSVGPTFLMAIVLTILTVAVGVVCLMQFPRKPVLPYVIAIINILFLAFAMKSFEQLITYLPYTMDRVIATLVILLAYAASLSAQSAATVFKSPIFGWMDNFEPSDFGRIRRPAMPKTRPMQPARIVKLKQKPAADISSGRTHLKPIPQNSREAVR